MNVQPIASIRQVPVLEFGRGCHERVGSSFLFQNSETILIIAARSASAAVTRIESDVSRRPCRVHQICGIPAEPGVDDFEAVRSKAREIRPDVVVGIGGGSVLDVTKLVAAMHDSDQAINDAFGIDRLRPRRSRLVCLPTTAGAGSEVSPNAILLDRESHQKKAVISPHLVPDASFIDSSLTDSTPPELTAATGLDALCHCVEGYVNRRATLLTDAWALEGIRQISGALRRAFECGSDPVARDAVALGSLFGGLCLGPVNTTAVHALSYPLGGVYGVPHGVGNAMLLAPVAEFNLEQAIDRYADIARAMGITSGSDVHATARAGIDALRGLCVDVLGAVRLRDWGISETDLPALAASALTVTRLLDRNVREVTLADAVAIYRSVL